MSNAASLAPPCFEPRSAPMPPHNALYMSDPVPAMTRQAKVLALNSCSAYRFSEVCIARTQASGAGRPCSRCRKCAAMESSSVSTSIRRPFCDQCHQYSSIDPRLAISRSAMSRAPHRVVVVRLRSTPPSTLTPVRSTSIGCMAAGNASSAVRSGPGRPRNARSLVP